MLTVSLPTKAYTPPKDVSVVSIQTQTKAQEKEEQREKAQLWHAVIGVAAGLAGVGVVYYLLKQVTK